MEQADQLSVVLEEYKTLRAELLERHTAMMQVIAFSTAGLVATVGFSIAHSAPIAGIATFVALLLVIVIGVLIIDNDSWLLSMRLKQIEADVNQRLGNSLLVWETTYGIATFGYLDRAKLTWRRLFQ